MLVGYAKGSAVINAPAEVVWNCLNDIQHTPEWVIGLKAAEIVTSLPYGIGTIYRDHNQLGPFPQVTPWRITAFDALTHQVHESDSSVLPSKMIINLSPTSSGTQTHMIVEYRFLPRAGLVSQWFENLVMNRLLGQVIRRNLSNLNAYLQRQVNITASKG